jgi:molybdopterin molybdotransferase
MPAARLSVDDAVAAILAEAAPLPGVHVPLADALGGVLAEDIVAPFALPQWTNAAMDGYAVHGDDVRDATIDHPITLPVIAHIAAGAAAPGPLARGETMRIFTGGPVPDGADTIIRQEDSDCGAETVRIHDARDVGRHVRRAGSDVAAGRVVLPRGHDVGPGEISLLAALAITAPLLHRQPFVAIVSSGDELASLDDPAPVRAGTRLADSNTPTLSALTHLAGGTPLPLGPVPDDPDALVAAIGHAASADLLVTVGGVSVGDHDHVPAVLERLGARLLFRRVLLRPGGPTTAARLADGRLWIALPGNPVSAMVTFTLFVRPAIRRLLGDSAPLRPVVPVRLVDPIERDLVLDLYLRASRGGASDSGMPLLRATGPVGSALLTTMRGAEFLVRVPAGRGAVAAETPLEAISFP